MLFNFVQKRLAQATVGILPLLFTLNLFAQHEVVPVGTENPARLKKLSPQDKERIFGTQQSWEQKYETRFKTAPAEVQQRILKERADIQKRGKKYTVGYTAVSGPGLAKKIAGFVGLPPLMRTPHPHNAGTAPPQLSCLEESAQPTASAVDMRDYAIVTPARYQGGCGDCWAFGVTGGLETAVLMANGNYQGVNNETLALSEEQVLSCTGATDFAFGIAISGDDCGGGLSPSGANYVSEHSIVPSSSWPYAGAPLSNQCTQYQSQPSPYKARDWGWICDPGSGGILGELAVLTGIHSYCLTPSNEAIKQAIVEHGSAVASMYVGGDCPSVPPGPPLCFYTGGVFDENLGAHYGSVPQVDHVIQIIGWDDRQQAWLIKNSWGPDWGENGFGWIAYNTNNIGSFAVWLDAEQFNNACTGAAAPNVVYFRGTDNKLWKVLKNGSQQSWIGNNYTNSTPFVTADGWVYFQGTDNRLLKVRSDGSGGTQIGGNSTNSTPFATADGWVYFQGTDNRLLKVRSDGSGGTQIGGNSAKATPFVTPDGWVYFQGTDNRLLKVRSDGSGGTQIGGNATAARPFVTADGWVYFKGTDWPNGRLLKVRSDGSGGTQIGNNYTASTPFVTPDGWVYFQGTDNNLWIVFNDGSQQNQIGSNTTSAAPFVTSASGP